jgi:PAS domain S-box-containing protein
MIRYDNRPHRAPGAPTSENAKLLKWGSLLPVFGQEFDIDPAAVVEAVAESILITTTDLDAPGPLIVYVNPAFERMTGWSSSEVLGKSPRIFQGPKTDLKIFSDLREKLLSRRFWEGQTINYRKRRLRVLDGVVHRATGERAR